MTTEPFIGPIQRAQAEWVVELNIECPFCKQHFDLIEIGDGESIRGIEPGESDRTFDTCCPECGEDFECETIY